MALTTFGLTPDDITGSSNNPSITAAFGGDATQATDRYGKASLTGTYMYPESDVIDGFHVPMMNFKFYDAFGRAISNSPTIRVRVPNNLNLTNFSEYSRTENVFGDNMGGAVSQIYQEIGLENVGKQSSGLTETSVTEGGTAGLLKYGATAAEAFLLALQKSLGSASGFLASGGLNSLAQAEFTGRAAVNPYAQLLYKGPQFRRYTVPVAIRPRSDTESKNALNIIKIFKLASSPSVQNRSLQLGSGTYTLQSFVFGYPHLTAFDINFKSPTENKVIFESKLCAIESVAVDYGGQKMAFFEDGVPTEINLTLQLSEISVRTLGDARYDSSSTKTIV
jgi:hypothetical protein